MLFVPNRGQLPDRVRLGTIGARYGVLIKRGGAELSLGNAKIEMRLRGARAGAPTGAKQQRGAVNYVRGRDPKQWQTRLRTYAEVRQQGVYEGIDLTYRVASRDVEYVFTLAPGAEPREIRISHDGARDVSIERDGRLRSDTSAGPLHVRAPKAFQGSRRVPVRYVLQAGGTVGFRLGRYDRSLPLVIDPVLHWTTLRGGAGCDLGMAVGAGPDNSVYLAGITSSASLTDLSIPKSAPGSGTDASSRASRRMARTCCGRRSSKAQTTSTTWPSTAMERRL